MHIDCTGEGSPTVILESGLGDTYVSWRKVQPEIAKFARVCSYDRAGLGYSDPVSAAAYQQSDRAGITAVAAAAGVSSALCACRPLHGRIRRAALRQLYPQLRLPAWCWWMLLIPIRTIAFHPS